MMKNTVIGFLVIFLLSGCASDVSDILPHSKLRDNPWELTTDAYVVENFDSKGVYRVIPCTEENYVYLPNWDWKFDEGNIGNKGQSEKIIAGLKKGTQFNVLRIIKDPNPEVGTRYYPIIVPLNDIDKIGKHELNAHLLYRGFYNQGTMNPKYVKTLEQ